MTQHRPQFQRSALLPGRIRGINRTSLWSSWKQVRKELRNSSVRDVVDFLDFDVNPDIWINRLLGRLDSGEYEPETPRRFTLGKSLGLSRTMTLPAIPDLVLYRAVVDYVYSVRSRQKRHKNVYFLRDELTGAQTRALDEATGRMKAARDFELEEGQYRFTGRKSFYNWLRFNQYRKYLLHEQAYPYIVVTDIANFFDTILHSHIVEAIQGLPLPRRMIGLLFFLLERLSIRQDYTSSHGISLPIDEFDCSRTLAHIVLDPHDDAIVQFVGEDRYSRWMDDQSIAAMTRADGISLLREVGRSLMRLHLTPNSQKSKVLSLKQARRHYHLDLNDALDRVERLSRNGGASKTARLQFQRAVRRIWKRSRRHDGEGEFDKVLKRVYRLAGLAGLTVLRRRAASDILANPSLVKRVTDYYRCTGSVEQHVEFTRKLMHDSEQIYPDVNVALTESMLRLEPNPSSLTELRRLAKWLIRRPPSLPGAQDCAAVATLLTLRFRDTSVRPLLKRSFQEKAPRQLARAAAFVYASESREAYAEVRRVASMLLRNDLSTMVHLIAEIGKYEQVPDRYRARLVPSSDSVAGTRFIDMRVILTARLLLLSSRKPIRDWVRAWCKQTLLSAISNYDRNLIRRLVIARCS